MLFVHEIHRVMGRHEEGFEEAFRAEWMPSLAETPDARLLYFMRLAHGTGRGVQLRDRHRASPTARPGNGSPAACRSATCAPGPGASTRMRWDVTAKMLAPAEWSPLQSVDFEHVPTDAGQHDQTLFMEDTAWPHAGMLEEYLEAARDNYAPSLAEGRHGGRSLLELQAVFCPAWGAAARRREVILWQRVTRPSGILGLLTSEVPAEHRAPGTWMHDALRVRDDWESRLLRTAPWSPLF